MILSILFFISQIALGFIVIIFFDPEKRFYLFEKILGAIILGSVLGGFFVLGLALLLKSLLTAILIFISVVSVCMIIYFWHNKLWLYRPKISLSVDKILSRKNSWIIPLIIIIILYWILINSILFNSPNKTLKTDIASWGDTAIHLEIIQRMVTAKPFIIDNPVMGNTHLTYSFLIDFISAIYLKLDANKVFAFRFPLLLYCICAVLLIFFIGCRILISKYFAVLALFLILYGSGFGFSVLFKDLQLAYQQNGLKNIPEFFINPPHEYTFLTTINTVKPQQKGTDENIVWMVPIISLLSHQRGFPIGLAVFSFILIGIILYGQSSYFWRFGIIAGLLPIIHIHSFLALFFLMAVLFWFNIKYWKSWTIFGIITTIIALPQIFYFRSGNNILNINIFKPWFGWMTNLKENPFAFWSNNFGFIFLLWLSVLIIMIIFIVLKKYILHLKISFVIASLILFILPNIFLFQSWNFDNNKILFYWWILAILFCVTPLLQFIWQKKLLGKISVIIIVIFSVMAGSIDVMARLIAPQNTYYGYSDSDNNKVTIAQWIQNNTLANSLFLTSSSIDPAPLFLAGRPIYLGYNGWLWGWGLDYLKNQKIAEQIINGNLILACQEKIDYILLDNDLRRDFPAMKENQILSKGIIVFSQQTASDKTFIIKTPCL